MAETIELEGDGKTFVIDLAEAEKELGIAHGDTKEVTVADLVEEGQKLPLFVIRPHQTLVVKSDAGKLGCFGCVGGGRMLSAERIPVEGATEVRITAHDWFKGHQGNGNAWLHLTDCDGHSKKLCFGYMLTKG